MAVCWSCPKCEVMTGGSAAHYGALCDECSGRNEEKRKEIERWKALPLEEKVEELKVRLDSIQPVIDNSWFNMPIG